VKNSGGRILPNPKFVAIFFTNDAIEAAPLSPDM